MKRSLLALLSALSIYALPTTGQAIVASIDLFGIDKNGVSYFADGFGNGLTPSQESRYSVFGSFPNGAESGGFLTLDSDWGGLASNAAGQLRQTLGALYLSPLSSSGLTVHDTIDVFGLFNLVVPAGPLINGYGLQVRNSTNDLYAELDVQYNPSFGGDVIRYLAQDFTNGTVTTLGFVTLAPPLGANQIALDISKPDANSPNFYGAYAYCSNGVCNDADFKVFETPLAMFETTDYVRGRFIAFTAVPEPGALTLLGVGLAGLAAMRRRRL
ncbi:MAG TPA: PEP-CTERM sorting domain-containing protein [Burkholderiaceae bacterium]|nr:PEP-CTERM sorting domain-containing protein [Burkholderiaceae bacterium]